MLAFTQNTADLGRSICREGQENDAQRGIIKQCKYLLLMVLTMFPVSGNNVGNDPYDHYYFLEKKIATLEHGFEGSFCNEMKEYDNVLQVLQLQVLQLDTILQTSLNNTTILSQEQIQDMCIELRQSMQGYSSHDVFSLDKQSPLVMADVASWLKKRGIPPSMTFLGMAVVLLLLRNLVGNKAERVSLDFVQKTIKVLLMIGGAGVLGFVFKDDVLPVWREIVRIFERLNLNINVLVPFESILNEMKDKPISQRYNTRNVVVALVAGYFIPKLFRSRGLKRSVAAFAIYMLMLNVVLPLLRSSGGDGDDNYGIKQENYEHKEGTNQRNFEGSGEGGDMLTIPYDIFKSLAQKHNYSWIQLVHFVQDQTFYELGHYVSYYEYIFYDYIKSVCDRNIDVSLEQIAYFLAQKHGSLRRLWDIEIVLTEVGDDRGFLCHIPNEILLDIQNHFSLPSLDSIDKRHIVGWLLQQNKRTMRQCPYFIYKLRKIIKHVGKSKAIEIIRYDSDNKEIMCKINHSLVFSSIVIRGLPDDGFVEIDALSRGNAYVALWKDVLKRYKDVDEISRVGLPAYLVSYQDGKSEDAYLLTIRVTGDHTETGYKSRNGSFRTVSGMIVHYSRLITFWIEKYHSNTGGRFNITETKAGFFIISPKDYQKCNEEARKTMIAIGNGWYMLSLGEVYFPYCCNESAL